MVRVVDEEAVNRPGKASCIPGRKAAILLLLGFGLWEPLLLSAQGRTFEETVSIPDPPLYSGAFLINAGSLLFDLESYGGGIGFKIGRQEAYLRFLTDLYIRTLTRGFSITLGTTYERHFVSGALSPYWGVTASLGVATQKDAFDSANWLSVTAIPIGVTGLLGMELFVTEHVSLFFEYALMAELAIMHTAQSVAGTVSRDTYTDFRVDTGLGNQSKLGVAFYLPALLCLPRLRVPASE